MNCPTCGRLTWPYDDDTLTCKKGHHTPTGAAETARGASTGLPVPAWAWGLPGIAALTIEIGRFVF